MENGRGSDPTTTAMDDVEAFRRIHVQPYNGNFLKALFEVGENLRTLVIDMSANDDGNNELIGETLFADRYTDIIRDFEVLRNTNISPSLEIQEKTQHMSEHKRTVMWQWVLRTAQLLSPPRPSFPIQPSVRQAIVPITKWLQKRQGAPYSDNNRQRTPEQLRMFDHYHDLINPRSRGRDSPIQAFQKTYDPGLFFSTNISIEVESDDFNAPGGDPRGLLHILPVDE